MVVYGKSNEEESKIVLILSSSPAGAWELEGIKVSNRMVFK